MVRLVALSSRSSPAPVLSSRGRFSPVNVAEFSANGPLFSLASRSALVRLASEAARREPDAPETVRLLSRADGFDKMPGGLQHRSIADSRKFFGSWVARVCANPATSCAESRSA